MANGNCRARILFYGFMEHVRSPFQTYSSLCIDVIIAGTEKTKLVSVVVNNLRRNLEKKP